MVTLLGTNLLLVAQLTAVLDRAKWTCSIRPMMLPKTSPSRLRSPLYPLTASWSSWGSCWCTFQPVPNRKPILFRTNVVVVAQPELHKWVNVWTSKLLKCRFLTIFVLEKHHLGMRQTKMLSSTSLDFSDPVWILELVFNLSNDYL